MYLRILKRFITWTIVYVCSLQLAFAQSIFDKPKQRVDHIMDIKAKFEPMLVKFYEDINGKDDTSNCDDADAQAMEKAVTKNSSSLDEIDEFKVNESKRNSSIERRDFEQEAQDKESAESLAEEAKAKKEEELVKDSSYKHFMKLMSEMRTNASGVNIYEFDKTATQDTETKCVPVHTDGIIDRVADRKMALDKEDEENEDYASRKGLTADDKDLNALRTRAELILTELGNIISNRKEPDHSKRAYIIQYLERVLIPLRDLVVMKRSNIQGEYDVIKFYSQLSPVFPKYLFPEDDIQLRKRVTIGQQVVGGAINALKFVNYENERTDTKRYRSKSERMDRFRQLTVVFDREFPSKRYRYHYESSNSKELCKRNQVVHYKYDADSVSDLQTNDQR